MNIFKRAWISIMRKKTNSLVLLLIVFILANVLLTTLTVTNSLKNTKQMVLKQFPPVVSVDYNYEDKDNNWKKPELTAQMVEQLYQNTKDIVESYDYSQSISLTKSDEIKLAEIPGSEQQEEFSDLLAVYGTQLAETNLVAQGKAKLISGQGFSETDIKEGKPKIIVTKQFAEINDFAVGSFITLTRNLYTLENITGSGASIGEPFFSEDVELEIIGILEIEEVEKFIKKQEVDPTKVNNDIFQMQYAASTIYATNSFITPLKQDNIERQKEKYPEGYDEHNFIGQSNQIFPEFFLKDINDLDAFIEKATKIFNENDFAFTSAANEYEAVAKPLKSMENLLDLVFKITVLASILVLSLVLCIFMYLRQKEIGIYLALGEKRSKIIGQLLLETLIVALIGATLAIFTSVIFSNILMENTITSLLTPSEDTSMGISSIFNINYGISAEFISEQYQSGLGMITFVIFYATMIITIILSQLATVLYLLRLNPKKILM